MRIQFHSESLKKYGADIDRLADPNATEQFAYLLEVSSFIHTVLEIYLQYALRLWRYSAMKIASL